MWRTLRDLAIAVVGAGLVALFLAVAGVHAVPVLITTIAVFAAVYFIASGVERRRAARAPVAPPDEYGALLATFDDLLTKGIEVEHAYVKNPFDDGLVIEWERRARDAIAGTAGGSGYGGLFASADRVTQSRPLPADLKDCSPDIQATWRRLDHKIEWLRHQSKEGGPHR